MKKELKKLISHIIPRGNLKEKLKLIYYNFNFNKPSYTTFSILHNGQDTVYKTDFHKLTLLTNEALYTIVADFNYYLHFYQLKQGDVIMDAGANCGHLTVFFSKSIGDDGRVYAFEPDRFNIERIRKNMSLNISLPNNIIIENLLLWNENTSVDFYEAGTVGSSAIWMPEKDKCVKKDAVTIDSWVSRNNIAKLDFIKMDIEGAEIKALDGCVETIQKFSPNFAIASYHLVNGEQTYIKLEKFFSEINYPYKTVRFRGNEIITFAGPSVKNN